MLNRRLFAWTSAGLGCAALLAATVLGIGRSSNAFVGYYTSSRLLLEGADVVQMYDNDWFGEQVHRFEPGVREIFWANPPTMALLAAPVAWLPYRAARAAWIVLSLALFACAVTALVSGLEIDGLPLAFFLAFVGLAHPVHQNLSQGQVYLVMTALLTLAWSGYVRFREFSVGSASALVLALKTAALPLWALFFFQKRWRVVGWGAAVAVGLALVSLPWIGPSAWARYPIEAGEVMPGELVRVTAYQTLPGIWRHLFGTEAPRAGAPLLESPLLAHGGFYLTAAVMLGMSLWAAARRGASSLVFGLFVLLGIVVSPVSSEAHFAMAVIPGAILCAEVARVRSTALTAVLVLAAALLAIDVPYWLPRFGDGPVALLAYPRLYGALALWGLALGLSLRPERITAETDGRRQLDADVVAGGRSISRAGRRGRTGG